MSIIDSSSDVKPIFMSRLVDDNGCNMTGGAAQVGNVGIAVCMRSATCCRAVMRSVPGSKIITIVEYWGTDLERMTSSRGTPLSACSIGMVIKASTSAAERPIAAVCTSTFGGANSGKTSTGMARSSPPPKTIIATARPTTRYLNLRLDPTIQRIMGVDLHVNAMGRGFPDGE